MEVIFGFQLIDLLHVGQKLKLPSSVELQNLHALGGVKNFIRAGIFRGSYFRSYLLANKRLTSNNRTRAINR